MRGERLGSWFLLCWFALPGVGWAQTAVSSGADEVPDKETPAVSAPDEPDHPADSESAASRQAPNEDRTAERSAVSASSEKEEAADQQSAVSPRPVQAAVPASTPSAGTIFHGQTPDANTPPDTRKLATPQFGEQGQVTISGSAGLQIRGTNHSNSDAAASGISVTPSLDFFVARHFSIGGFISASYHRMKYYQLSVYGDSELLENESNYIGVGPRIGYNFAFADLVSWYVILGFSYGMVSRNTQTLSKEILLDTSEKIFALRAFAPLLAHVATHFYIGFGPFLYTELSHSYGSSSNAEVRETTVGAEVTVGGWL